MAGDWYKIQRLSPALTAIGEPRYHQQNWSYLVEGADRALLFDTGSWFGNMAEVVHGLTSKPLIVLPSHMHYDHLGNIHRFDTIHLPDLPVLRQFEEDGHVTPSAAFFLGAKEGHQSPRFTVSQWLPIGAQIDLGGTVLELWHTPGHSPDSVSLWWEEAGILLAADFLYHGPLFAQVPNASLSDYLTVARDLKDRLPESAAIYGAHGDARSPEVAMAPGLEMTHLGALIGVLETLREDPPALDGTTLELPVCPLNTLVLGQKELRSFISG